MSGIAWLQKTDAPAALPPTSRALREPNGLLAVGGSLTPEWLVHAYRRGVFPWYSAEQPILWWAPDPRAVLLPPEFRVSRSLARSIRRRGYETRIDTAFEAVIEACAGPRHGMGGTWITREMHAAYATLHRRGLAHSFETWHGDRLVGGLYGVGLGRAFFGESMFTRATDAWRRAQPRRRIPHDLIGCRARATWPDRREAGMRHSSLRRLHSVGRWQAVSACSMLAMDVDGCAVETIEGLSTKDKLHPLQEAFMEFGALQCGYCTSGFILTAKALLAECPHPSEQQIRDYLAGNFCRCGCYQEIVQAIKNVRSDA